MLRNVLLVALIAFISGCGGGSGTEKAPTPTGPDIYVEGTHPRFDPVISDLPFNTDLIFAAGGGIFGHPGGVAQGVTAMRQAWDAAVAGVDVRAYAERHPELKAALGFW